MIWLINEVNVCDYGDGESGSCLVDKTNNSSNDAEEHILTRCNGCGRSHNCAVISTARLKLKDGVQFASGIEPKPKKKPSAKSGLKGQIPRKRAGIKKPATR